MDSEFEDFLGFNRHNYEKEQKWRFVHLKKYKVGKIQIGDRGPELVIEGTESEIGKYSSGFISNQQTVVTCSANDDSRLYLINGSAWPAGYSFSDKKRKLIIHPRYTILQRMSNKKMPLETSEISGNIPCLEDWLEVNQTDFSLTNREFKNKKDSLIHIDLGNEDLWLGVAFQWTMNEGFTAKNQGYIKLGFRKPVSYIRAISEFKVFEEFFNFVFSHPNAETIFSSTKIKDEKLSHFNSIAAPWYEHYVRPNDSSWDMLFHYKDFKNIDEMIKKWFEVYKDLTPILDNLRFIKVVDVAEETRFMTLVNSLEILHRKFYDYNSMDKDDFKLMLKRIKAGISKDDWSAISARVAFAYEPTLAERLRDIQTKIMNFGIPYMAIDRLDKISKTRNYFTHHNESLKSKILNIIELSEVNTNLAAYIKALILSILGASDDAIKGLAGYSRSA